MPQEYPDGRSAAELRTAGQRASPPGTPARATPPAAGGPGRALTAAALPAADAAALAAAATVAVALPGAHLGAGPAALFAGGLLTALALGGLHRRRICLRVADQAGRIAVAALVAAAALLAGTALIRTLLADTALARAPVPAGTALGLALLSVAAVLAARTAAAAGLRAARRRGALAEPAVIVGSGTFAAHLAGQLREHPELGVRVAGFLDDGPPRRDLTEPVLGRPRDLAPVVRELGIRRILITFGEGRDEDLVPVLRACADLPVEVCVVPRLYELGLAVPRGSLDEIWGIPLIPLRRTLRPAGLAAKRAFDIVVASLLLVAAAPVLLTLGTIIRLRTGQPAVFRQLRVTGTGHQATILKLRTVTEAPVEPVPAQRRWAPEPGQCRPLGRWLRATHLDELPQLVNVIKGDMSLVGPRPERGCFATGFARQIPRYADRDRVRAGLTGWAQVHGLHGDTSIVARSRFDNQYIEYWSPWLDLVILVRTIRAALTRPASHPEAGQ
jgi:exopolysaccharide biosynthesis polyprenyl glycosylphosphotransferase